MNLIDAVINNDIEMVRQLLEEGADPNVCIDEAQLRPLHFAAQNNSLEIAKLLITAGADVHARTIPDDETPLEVAKLHGHRAFVELILSHSEGSEQIN